MAKVPLYDQNKTVIGEIELSDEIFCSPVKDYLIYDAVKMYLANKRQGTASTKTRGEVSGGGKKPWRQKGTGRARVGSIRSPLWRKGGIVFGPKPRDYSYRLPKKVLKSAMRSALSLKLSENKLFVVDKITLPEIKTKMFYEIVKKFEFNKVLFVLPERDKIVELSSRNIPNVKVLKSDYLNVYELMKYDELVFVKDAIKNIEGALSV